MCRINDDGTISTIVYMNIMYRELGKIDWTIQTVKFSRRSMDEYDQTVMRCRAPLHQNRWPSGLSGASVNPGRHLGPTAPYTYSTCSPLKTNAPYKTKALMPSLITTARCWMCCSASFIPATPSQCLSLVSSTQCAKTHRPSTGNFLARTIC